MQKRVIKKSKCFVQIRRAVIAILFGLFTATSISYAGFFKESPETADSSKATTENYGGFFRSDGDPAGPGNRPGEGTGVGQDAPLGSGLGVLVVCSFVLGIVKFFNGKPRRDVACRVSTNKPSVHFSKFPVT